MLLNPFVRADVGAQQAQPPLFRSPRSRAWFDRRTDRRASGDPRDGLAERPAVTPHGGARRFDVPCGATIMLSPFYTPASGLLDRSRPLRPRSEDTGCRDHPSWALLLSLRSRPADLHWQQLLAAREPPAARDPRATLPPTPARWIRTALRHARHAEHRGRPAGRDRDAVIRCFVGARRGGETDPTQPPPWALSLTLPYDVGIPLLDRLFADPTRYVTGSVANHVNDISEKDPHLALDTLEWWRGSGH